MTKQRVWRWTALALLLAATWLGVGAAWIPAKAALAQVLLERAWIQSDHGRHAQRPWPWADIAPVARLRVPRLHRDLIVLDGDNGQALAFGPGWTPRGRTPGGSGPTVISAHRDTQFGFLHALRVGDTVTLDDARGPQHYRVVDTRVADSRHARPHASHAGALLLVTCYPFDAVLPGGPLRYVVEAWPMAACCLH